MNTKLDKRFWVLLFLIIFATLTRFIPHAWNMTSIGAVALFGGRYLKNSSFAYIIPLVMIWMTDLFLNNLVYAQYFDSFQWFGNIGVYMSIIAIVLIGKYLLKRISIVSVLGTSVGAAVAFFLITNFVSWIQLPMYSKDLSGLLSSYTLAIPFFKGTLVGNLFYSTVLFGVFEWTQHKKLNLQLLPQKHESNDRLDDLK